LISFFPNVMTETIARSSGYTQGYHNSVTRSHASRTAADCAAFLLPHLKPDMKILDVGCGPGTISCDFADIANLGSVVGIDVAAQVLEQARRAANSKCLTNIAFETQDILQGLSHAENSFDVVYCHQLLLHLPEPVKALQEMKRVCKAGGLVAAREGDWQSIHFHPSNDGVELYKDTLAKIYRAGGGSDTAGRQLQAWARRAGFPSEAICKTATTLSYSSSEERDWWASLHIERIGKSDLREQGVHIGATEEDFDKMIEGWQEWRGDVDACWTMVQGEILCTV
jgi:ubiquinone/menaquinone biosynthesis C-methylase UbiE